MEDGIKASKSLQTNCDLTVAHSTKIDPESAKLTLESVVTGFKS